MKRPRISKESLKSARSERAEKQTLKQKIKDGFRVVNGVELPPGAILANWDALEHNKATFPDIAYPRYYADRSFTCRDCGDSEIWTAGQQKWWYETAKGPIDSIAVRCHSCRRKERERAAAAREAHLTGLAREAQKSDS